MFKWRRLERQRVIRGGVEYVQAVQITNAYPLAKPEHRFVHVPVRVQIATVRPFITRQRYAFVFFALLFAGFFAFLFAVFVVGFFTFLFAVFFAGFRSGL